MAAINYFPDVLETAEAERLATGFIFTEGPLWHPDGHYFFVDIRTNSLYRLRPGRSAELVTKTIGGNGTTFDLEGRLIVCEGEGRRVSRLDPAGKLVPVAELPFEFMLNALRLVEGFEVSLFSERTGLPIHLVEKQLKAAEEKGLLARDWKRIRPTERGRHFLNELLEAFLPG